MDYDDKEYQPFNTVLRLENVYLPGKGKHTLFRKKRKKESADKSLNVDLAIHSGITIITGDNGSGKTSIVKAFDPISGCEIFDGKVHYYDTDGKELDYRQNYGIICNRFIAVYPKLEDNHWKEKMTIGDILAIYDDLEVSYDRELLFAWFREFSLSATKQLKYFSSGEQYMVSLLLALARKPDVLILDEMGSLLSLINRPKICKILNDYIENSIFEGSEGAKVNRAIIITSNHPCEEERMLELDHVVVLSDLDVVANLTMDGLLKKFRGKQNIEEIVSEMLEKRCWKDEAFA